MKKAKVLENLMKLLARLEHSGISTLDEDRALGKVVQKMIKQQDKERELLARREGKYTVIFAYPERLTDGQLQVCVEFVCAESVVAAKRKACGLGGITVIAVFKGHRKCLYSEA